MNGVNGIHQLIDSANPFRIAGERACSRTLDNRRVIAVIIVLGKQLADFHFHQLQDFRIIDKVNLVHEYHDLRNANLLSEQDMLFRLRHRAVGSGYYEDSAIHLGRAGDHVLHIIGVTRAVNVRIVAGNCFRILREQC